jgi:hypothetical protein
VDTGGANVYIQSLRISPGTWRVPADPSSFSKIAFAKNALFGQLSCSFLMGADREFIIPVYSGPVTLLWKWSAEHL